MNKSEIISQLQNDSNLGIAYAQSGSGIKVMTYREFLNWYADAGYVRMTIKEIYNDELGCDDFFLIHHNNQRGSNYKELSKKQFDTKALAENEYYKCLERDYYSDNGAGGLFYENKEAIIEIEDGNYDLFFYSEDNG